MSIVTEYAALTFLPNICMAAVLSCDVDQIVIFTLFHLMEDPY